MRSILIYACRLAAVKRGLWRRVFLWAPHHFYWAPAALHCSVPLPLPESILARLTALCGASPHPRPTNPLGYHAMGWSGGGVGWYRLARLRKETPSFEGKGAP